MGVRFLRFDILPDSPLGKLEVDEDDLEEAEIDEERVELGGGEVDEGGGELGGGERQEDADEAFCQVIEPCIAGLR